MLTIPIEIYEKIITTKFVPDTTRVFRAFSYFQPRETKVIIIGQDPYPNRKDACGLAFSVEHEKYPPSLRNVFTELCNDMGYKSFPKTGNLEAWAKQGVLLLNSILTTGEGQSLAHENIGWEEFTRTKMQNIVDYKQPLVIIAWGKYANEVVKKLNLHDKVLVLQGAHPSPLNKKGGFLGGRYFSKTNKFLKKHGLDTIKWKL